jgi:hypothetical protein
MSSASTQAKRCRDAAHLFTAGFVELAPEAPLIKYRKTAKAELLLAELSGRTQFKRLGQIPVGTQDGPLIYAIREQRRRRSFVLTVARAFVPQPPSSEGFGARALAVCLLLGSQNKSPSQSCVSAGANFPPVQLGGAFLPGELMWV